MLDLIPWQGEPESARMLVVFTGARANFRDGLLAWLRHRGSLDLFGAPLSSETLLPWPAGQESWILSFGSLPEYAMLGWWLGHAPEWTVFYQPDNGNREHTQDYAELDGCFLPWGSTWARTEPHFVERSVVWHASGRLRLPERLGNVFEEFDKQEALEFAARAAAIASDPRHSAPHTDGFELKLADAVDRAPSNPRSELDRMRTRIQEMEEQAATLDWLVRDQAADVFLWVYPELDVAQFAAGAYWDLRNWFHGASDEAIAEFTHARVEVEGIGKAFGQQDDRLVLHILKPEELSRPVRHAPPLPAWKLRLDRSWRREGSKVFVLEGLELRPAPPQRNKHVCDLLRSALWQGCEPTADILLLLRHLKRDFRFSVKEQEFKKLSERVNELNRQVALESLRRSETGSDAMELIFASIRVNLQERLTDHTDRMKGLLADAWERRKAELNMERERVMQAELNADTIHSSSNEIQRLHSEISALARKEWGAWEKVVSGILQADRGLLPPERGDLRNWLDRLDNIRAEIAQWWRPGRDRESRDGVARRLNELANEVRI